MTYEKRLGWLNADHIPPIVEAGGYAWMTKGSVPVMVPDDWENDPHIPLLPLPADIEAVRV